MAKIRPGKGAQFMLSQDLIDWLMETMEIVNNVYTGEQNEEDPEVIIKELCLNHDFEYEKDSYGIHAYRTTPYPVTSDGGEVRLNVVLVKSGVLMLDLRPWGNFQTWQG